MDERFVSDAPPRFAYESDSSDDAFEDPEAGPAPSPRSRKASKAAPVVNIECTVQASDLFVLIGEAGVAITACLSGLRECGQVHVDGDQAAIICLCQSAVFILALASIDLDAQTPLAKLLLARLRPSRLHCIDSYSLQNYLATEGTAADEDALPNLRFLQTENRVVPSPRLQLFDVPNLVTGLSAALMAQAVYSGIPALLVLAPSMASSSSLHSSIAHPRYRPGGIYDPTEANEDGTSIVRLFLDLTAGDKAALRWDKLTWSAQPRSELDKPDPWKGLQPRTHRQESRSSEYDGLYL